MPWSNGSISSGIAGKFPVASGLCSGGLKSNKLIFSLLQLKLREKGKKFAASGCGELRCVFMAFCYEIRRKDTAFLELSCFNGVIERCVGKNGLW